MKHMPRKGFEKNQDDDLIIKSGPDHDDLIPQSAKSYTERVHYIICPMGCPVLMSEIPKDHLVLIVLIKDRPS